MATLVRWNPVYGVRPGRRYASRYDWRMSPNWDTRVVMPLDIEENEDNFVIKASVPGFAPEDLKIEVEDGVLTIRAEHTGEDEQEREGWHLRERYVGSVERRLRLGKDVDAEAVEAELEHGVLTLTLSKVEAAKPKLIEVKAAK
jgi:HSP20 family protein